MFSVKGESMKEQNEKKVKQGLTSKEVQERIEKGLVHANTDVPTKSIGQIIRTNLFTLFNMLNFGLGLAVLLVGSYKNLLFLGIVFCNMLISIFQEIRAKRTVDKLSLFNETKVEAIRDGKKVELAQDEIVLDEVIHFYLGNQVLVDSEILEGECLVNESFITGEETPIKKSKGDLLLSGSFLVSGDCFGQCIHIKEDNYTSKISKDAKYLKKLNSELMISLNKIIKGLSMVVIPVGILLFWAQMRIPGNTIQDAVIHTVAGLIGMIPDGLILLTSTVLAVSVIRLSKYKVLVQELYCIEMLARVDVLCLDKTGTLTEGKMEVKDLLPVGKTKKEEVMKILSEMGGALVDQTPTMESIRVYCPPTNDWKVEKTNPFSSDTKLSSVTFKEGEYLLGAPAFVLGKKNYKIDITEYEKEYRVLLLAKKEKKEIEELAYLLIQDKVRENAKKTLTYFKDQQVTLKIISGDNPVTVSQIAKRVGVDNYDKYIDLTDVDSSTFPELVEKYTIFGRVKPAQKKELVLALKKGGHTVAMTGDGVNDVLALKEADCGIAMASGSAAARSVSQLVLLDSDFDSMPKIVQEGRQTINNIERSASLFLVKTIYTTLLAVFFLFVSIPYPFEPIQMSLTNMVTIGIPAFILALELNKERVKGGFLKNVLSKALPTSLCIFAMLLLIQLSAYGFGIEYRALSTISVLMVAVCGFFHLFTISRPFTKLRGTLLISMIIVFLLEVTLLPDLFSLVRLDQSLFLIFLMGFIVSLGLFYYLHLGFNYLLAKKSSKKV